MMNRSEVNEKFKELMHELEGAMENPIKKTRRIAVNRTCKAILILGYEWGKSEVAQKK